MVPLETKLCLKFIHIDVGDFDFGEMPARQILKYGAQCIPVSFATLMLRVVLYYMGPPEGWSIFWERMDPSVYTTELWKTLRW